MPSWPARLFHGRSDERTRRSSLTPSPVVDPSSPEFPFSISPAELHRPPFPRSSTSPGGRTHTRSPSHPLPSLFGGGHRRNASAVDVIDDDTDSSDSDSPGVVNPSLDNIRQKVNGKYALGAGTAHDVVTTTCMTCNSRLRPPEGQAEFRCTVCLTLNDLVPRKARFNFQGKGKQPDSPDARQSDVPYPSRSPLSLDTTMETVTNCITSYGLESLAVPLHAANGGLQPPYSVPEQGLYFVCLSPDVSPRLPQEPPAHNIDYAAIIREQARKRLRSWLRRADQIKEQYSDNGQMSIQGATYKDGSGDDKTSLIRIDAPPRSRPHTRSNSELTNIFQHSIPTMPTRPPPAPPSDQSVSPTEGVLGSPKTAETDILPPAVTGSVLELNSKEYAMYNRRRHHHVKAAFKPLEDYLVSVFGDYECLNASFLVGKPTYGLRTRSEGCVRFPKTSPRQNGHDYESRSPEAPLDPKLLMVGDFAENGAWWSGRIERPQPHISTTRRASNTSSPWRLTSKSSPRINWQQLMLWYDEVLGIGNRWDDARRSSRMPVSDRNESDDVARWTDNKISRDLKEIRIHNQRVLLKVTENLLKRPGRPLTEPDDIRFLLILLSNPLLHPSSYLSAQAKADRRIYDPRSGTWLDDAELHNSSHRRSGSRALSVSPYGGGMPHQRRHSASSSDLGLHSGIIKRILGLMANLPSRCHHQLIVWFTSLEEDHFKRIVNLVSSFVTYRLTRQQDRRGSTQASLISELVPELTDSIRTASVQLHDSISSNGHKKPSDGKYGASPSYSDDWQIKAAAKVMHLLFLANNRYYSQSLLSGDPFSPLRSPKPSSPREFGRQTTRVHGQLLPTSDFYNTLLDFFDIVADFEDWERRRPTFHFCQYPMFLSIAAKIKILEHDARRQMADRARKAFFNSITSNRQEDQYFHLRVRRDCLVDDSLRRISETFGAAQEEIKKALKVHFHGEEGVDAGGLRKEWFLLLAREIFDPNYGMFVYDNDSNCCYFAANSFETSEQYFLVGALFGLAIYNSTILEVALPAVVFKKLLARDNLDKDQPRSLSQRSSIRYTLQDLAEWQPSTARNLEQLLSYRGDVEQLSLNFTIVVDRYGMKEEIELCPHGKNRDVTNENVREYVNSYVTYLLETSVARQFEPFKRGFLTVCGGNALSLFRPEEIELLVKGSEEALDVDALRAVAVYENWNHKETSPGGVARKVERPGEQVLVLRWFWDLFKEAHPTFQRKILSFVTGSDRIPALGAASVVIRIQCLGDDSDRFPSARTCFNALQLYRYNTKEKLREKLWGAVTESEGFGLK